MVVIYGLENYPHSEFEKSLIENINQYYQDVSSSLRFLPMYLPRERTGKI